LHSGSGLARKTDDDGKPAIIFFLYLPPMKATLNILFLLVLLALIAPEIQKKTKWFQGKALNGVSDTMTRPHPTRHTVLSGAYQRHMQEYLEEKAGFRNSLIRLKNQLDYWLFNYTASPGVVIGKEGWLYIESYILNYTGRTFKGTARIDNEVRHLVTIQNQLKKRNIGFLVVFAPGKASFYPEYIPDRYKKRQVTNYEYYRRKITASGLNFMDLNAWFRSMKNKTPYPIYPKNGVHWTCYTIALAADTIFKFIEKEKKIDLAEVSWNIPMPYPEFIYNTQGKTRPRVMAVADSYWWGFAYTGITSNVFTKDNYWFYFRDIYENGIKAGKVSEVNLDKEIGKQDMVILLVTEATYELFPYGFIEAFYEKCMKEDQSMTTRINFIIERIKNTPEWFQDIQNKAKKNKITLDEQLKLDAKYVIDQEDKEKK
jgi:hypothetical protein